MKYLISWVLVAAGLFSPVMAAPCSSEMQRAFDFWLGDWTLVNRQLLPSQPERGLVHTGLLRSEIRTLAGGCVIFEQTSGQLFYGAVEGVSLRAWDVQEKHWTVINFWAVAGPPAFSRWQGRVENEGIRSIAETGGQPRIEFLNIASHGWEWVQREVDPHGAPRTSWIITAKRVAGSAAPGSKIAATDAGFPVNCVERKWHMSPPLPIAFTNAALITERLALPGVCALLERSRRNAYDDERPDMSGEQVSLIGFDSTRNEWRRFSYDPVKGRLLETTPTVPGNAKEEEKAHEHF